MKDSSRARRIIIVDDEPNIRLLLSGVLSDEGYVCEAVDSAEALSAALVDGQFDLVLLDVCLPGVDGLDWLRQSKSERKSANDPAVIMMSGHGSIHSALQAIKLGAVDFLEKPITGERLLLSVENALHLSTLKRENSRLRREAGRELLGESAAMQQLRDDVARTARSDATVLITGENGSGKEVVARSLQRLSRRSGGPFVLVNCAAIPRDLLESELFGHERGAFSGAVKTRRGRFELADSGSLLLDEIGDMPLELQSKLLRVLEDGEVTRLGAESHRSVDVRLFASTNRDLKKAIENGNFREDLYYRLAVVPLHVPPLREHREDVPLFVEHFLRLACERHGRGQLRLEEAAVARLQAAAWPGNLRQLRNLVERLVVLSDDDVVVAGRVEAMLENEEEGFGSSDSSTLAVGLAAALESHERELIELALREAEGNIAAAARRLEIDRANLHRKMRRLGIERP